MNPSKTDRRAFRHHEGDLAFSEHWHAQAIAMVELLVAEGKINAEEWSHALGAELDRRDTENAPDTDENYYSAFLSALEQFLDMRQFAGLAEVEKRERDWREAYLSTPHGKPVILGV